MTAGPTDRPAIRLYGRAGCGLCDEARATLTDLLAERIRDGRPAANLVEVDIDTDPTLGGELRPLIPVVELAGRRLDLAVSRGRLRRFLVANLDEPAAAAVAAAVAAGSGGSNRGEVPRER